MVADELTLFSSQRSNLNFDLFIKWDTKQIEFAYKTRTLFELCEP